MANITSVHVTSGIPDAGTGTVSTIDNLIIVGLPLTGGTVTVSGTVTSVVSGTTFISGGNLTAVVSGTAFISGGTVTSVISGTATINQAGAALSSTNGIFSNLLLAGTTISTSNALPVQLTSGSLSLGNITAAINIGGAAVSSTNGFFSNLTQNNATLTVTNGIYSNILLGNVVPSTSNALPVQLLSSALQIGQVTGIINIGGAAVSSTNGLFTNLTQNNATLTVTNGIYSNILLGNVVPSTSNPLSVQLVSGSLVLGSVTAAINQGGSAISSTNGIFANMLLGNAAISSTNPLMVEGDVASGVSDANNPIKIGGLAKSAQPTGVADGQRVNALFDLLGKQVVVQSIRGLKSSFYTTIATTGETVLIPAISTAFVDVYGAVIANKSGSTILMTFKDSVAGNTQFELEVPSFDTRGFMLVESAAFKQTAQNTTWTVTPSQATSISLSLLYVKNTTS